VPIFITLEDSILPGCDLLVFLVPDVLKDNNIFIFRVRQSVTHLTLKMTGTTTLLKSRDH